MKKIIGIIAAIVLCAGCANFKTLQTDDSFDPVTGKCIRRIRTSAGATTVFEGQSRLATWKASQTDKTQGATVGGLAQEATATNAVNAFSEGMFQLGRGLATGAAGGVK